MKKITLEEDGKIQWAVFDIIPDNLTISYNIEADDEFIKTVEYIYSLLVKSNSSLAEDE